MAAAISRAMLAINATLIYHASTYDVDGSRMSQDKTNRRNWRWQAVSCRPAGRHLFSPPRYPALGANKTCLINKCINIPAAHSRSPSFLPFFIFVRTKEVPAFPFSFFHHFSLRFPRTQPYLHLIYKPRSSLHRSILSTILSSVVIIEIKQGNSNNEILPFR